MSGGPDDRETGVDLDRVVDAGGAGRFVEADAEDGRAEDGRAEDGRAEDGRVVEVRAGEVPTARPGRIVAGVVFAVLVLASAVPIGSELYRAATTYPRATALAVLLFAAYAVPLLLFIMDFDYLEREPPVLLAAAFGWGGCVAMAVALTGNRALGSIMAKTISPEFAARWGPALVGASVEEPVKALGIIMIALMARWQINSVVDGLVYGAVVGLGFQVVEDVFYAVNTVAAQVGSDQLGPVVATFAIRGFVSGLWSHTVFTALAGAGIAYLLVYRHRGRPLRYTVAVLGVLAAWACHFSWNAPPVTAGVGFVVAQVLLKGVPALVLVLGMARVAARAEFRFYVGLLERLEDHRVGTPQELAALATAARRSAARKAARQRSGLAGARAAHRLQRAQARLAVELSRSARPCRAVDAAYRDVLDARRRMVAVSLRSPRPPAS